MNNLEALLADLNGTAIRIESGVNRIKSEPTSTLGEAVRRESAPRPIQTIEARVRELTSIAESISCQLRETAVRLDKAV